MDGLYLSNAARVLLQEGKTQHSLETSVQRLSSGLRINSAADDPSGLAVAETLSAKASGFERSAQNVQDANNALTVADGALGTITDLLQRIRTLVVQANSDITSANDDQAIQAQIDQALKEINTVSQNTQFNGRKLLDGSLDNSAATTGRIVEVPATPLADGTYQTTVSNYDGASNPGPLVSTLIYDPGVPAAPTTTTVTVKSFDPVNAVDPQTGLPSGAPGFVVSIDSYGKDAGFGPAQVGDYLVPQSAGQINGFVNYPTFPNVALQFTLANLSGAQDVGASQSFITYAPQAAKTGQPLSVQDGSNEGNTVAITIAGTSVSNLGIDSISVLAPINIDQNYNLSQSSSNQLAATDAEYRVDDALTTITSQRAQIGAQLVSLNADASNDTNTAANLRAAESNIRDTDIGSEVTTFTRNQILATYQQTLLKQTTAISQLILRLVS